MNTREAFEQVQQRKAQAGRALAANPEQFARTIARLSPKIREQLPDMPTGPAASQAAGGIAWVIVMAHDLSIDFEALIEVADDLERFVKDGLREIGGVMTPSQGVSAGIGAGFFTGLWMGWLLNDGSLTDARRAFTELDQALERRFPKNQSKELPGVTLFAAWENARKTILRRDEDAD